MYKTNQVGHPILIYNQIIFVVIFILLPLVAYCQENKDENVEEIKSTRFHDLKLDLFSTGRRMVTPVYEMTWNDKWGIEVGVFVNFRPRSIMEIDSPFTRFEFNSAQLKPYISLKRYFPFLKNKQHAFYLGSHSQIGYLLFVEEGYLEKKEEIFGTVIESASQTKGIQTLGLGIQSGIKFVFKKRIIIEPNLISTISTGIGKGAFEFGIMSSGYFTLQLKTGYRF